LSDVSIKGGATEYLRYDFEPDEITETQQGNSGNSWVWTGSVEDVSAGGSDHDGTYSLTRDMTDITVYAGAVRLTNPDTLYGVSTPADILGTIPLTPTVMPAGGDFPGRAGLNEAATAITDNNVMSSLAWWFILTSMVSITLGIGVWAWTTHEFWGALAWLSPYWIAYGAGGIFPLWLVMILTLVAVFFVLAVRKGREEL
ncbi:hypothetical protein KKH23_10550, partial [Patescibacteria group bacterium]|nr:hypothetical protein [Patescibacteria group bacterium]